MRLCQGIRRWGSRCNNVATHQVLIYGMANTEVYSCKSHLQQWKAKPNFIKMVKLPPDPPVHPVRTEIVGADPATEVYSTHAQAVVQLERAEHAERLLAKALAREVLLRKVLEAYEEHNWRPCESVDGYPTDENYGYWIGNDGGAPWFDAREALAVEPEDANALWEVIRMAYIFYCDENADSNGIIDAIEEVLTRPLTGYLLFGVPVRA